MTIRTLTDANAVVTVNSPDVFPGQPITFVGFATDDLYGINDLETVEAQMGVDGHAAFGYTPKLAVQDFMFMASSLTIDALEQIQSQQVQNQTVYILNGSVLLPAVQKRYVLVNGALTGYSPMPGAKRLLQPRKFTFTWEGIFPNVTA